MIKTFKKYFWVILIAISIIGLSGSAAYFSISGLSKLFAGSAVYIVIMASFIELAKIVTTAALHRFWSSISWALKVPLVLMVLIIMAITSSGIYGFLAEAYSTTSGQIEKIDGQIALVESQQEQKRVQISGIENIQSTKSIRISSLMGLRIQQEARIDSLYNRGEYAAAKKAQTLIDQSNKEIQSVQVELDTIANKINRVNEDIGFLDIKILELRNTDIGSEVGTLKYMSKITGSSVETIINWFIVAIMIAFDPLAILLIILANILYDRIKNDDDGLNSDTELEPKPKKEKLDIIDADLSSFLGEELSENDEADYIEQHNSYDFSFPYVPLNDDNEVFEYTEGEGGIFKKKEKESNKINSIASGIKSNPLYNQLIDVFYLNGVRNMGDTAPPYDVFLREIQSAGIDCEDKVVKNFLTISNLFGIVDMSNKDDVKILKSYEEAKKIISLVSN